MLTRRIKMNKKKLVRQLFFILVIALLVNGLNFQTLKAQSTNLKKEILIYIQPDFLVLPANHTGPVALANISKLSGKLRKVFIHFGVQSVSKAFPNFSEADTIRTLNIGKIIKIPHFARIFRINILNEQKMDSAISVLKKTPGILFAEKNSNARQFYDPDFSKQWYLNNTGQSGGVVDADIDAPEAWQIFTGSPFIKIAVIDGGVAVTHPDLIGKSSGDLPDATGDVHRNHGTHVAGIAAANANNGKGGQGVDWNAQIVSEKIFDGFGNFLGDANTANKIIDAIDNHNVDILNNSWGESSMTTTLQLAFAYAYKMNKVSVASMGNNDGSQTQYPAGLPQGIIAVGSTTDGDQRSGFSDYGNHIDVAAPGGINPFPNVNQHDIWSTWDDSTYHYLAGTSMAAPVVTGIASLLKGFGNDSLAVDLYNDDIEQIIRISADDVNSQKYPGWDQFLGTGRVNARGALDYLRAPYQFQQLTAGPGGTEVSVSSQYISPIYGAAGLPDGNYYVRQHKIERTVSFSHQDDFHIWGRGVATTGWSADPTFSLPWCGVSNVTNTSATLTTYVYEVWQINGLSVGSFIGWFPADVSGVNFAYSTVGKSFPAPSATITGPSVLGFKQDGTWTAHPSGGDGNYSYEWRYRFNGTGSWSGVVGTSSTYTRKMGTTDFELKVTVTSAGQTADATFYVTYSNNPPIAVKDKDLVLIPDHFVLQSNYPNPFNPTTTIRFGLPERSPVKLVIYNIAGQRVATLVNREMSAGYHQVQWNGKNRNGQQAASGVYIYRLTAGKQQFVKKMLLVR